MDNLLLKLDETVTGLFADWDLFTTCLASTLVGFIFYQIFTSRDPDSHPMLLARQAQASSVRQEGESAVFRSPSVPHGMPLNTGLNVKDPGTSKWSRGRDGDLRDIWRKVVAGPTYHEGNTKNERGSIFTVLGSDQIIEHNLADITRQINVIGQHIKQNGGSRVAIYLPNSIEFLATLFASAFYDLTVILLPYDKSTEAIATFLAKSQADTVVAAVGSFPFDAVTNSYKGLKAIVWVVDEGSKHMDWNEVPSGTGGAVNVSTWQDLVQDEGASASSELPPAGTSGETKNIIAFWPSEESDVGELVEYTQTNIVAAISGQIASLPTVQRISNSDLFLPADSLSTIYPLVMTLTALFSNASVALNSVAGRTPNLASACQGIAPSIIVASSSTLAKVHTETAQKLSSPLYKLIHFFQTRTLVQGGVMPFETTLSRLYDSSRPRLSTSPGKLRLIFTSAQADVETEPLSAEALSDLRIYTGARVVYALTAAKVAGAVAQTNVYDYRVNNVPEKYSHFGAPLNCVEVYFKDKGEYKTTDATAIGEIFARGPAVVGGEASLNIVGRFKEDHTLALV
ncbi:hypothetical protein B7463_g2848, partial [Scytalidium lignicola]